MTIHRMRAVTLALLTLMTVLAVGANARAAGPVKLVLSSHVGWQVDKTTEGSICTVASKHECQTGTPNAEPGAFQFPEGVGGAPNGNVYVADQGNHRVQEFTDTGEFVLMFGREVNATTHGAICAEEEIKTSLVKCKIGVSGTAAGALTQPQSITVDSITGNVYVQDDANWRVDEYTAGGQFVLMLGKEVDQTHDETPGSTEAQKNVCTALSRDVCKAGVEAPVESAEKGAFNFAAGPGNLLTVGGTPEHLLYVGDEHRVQEFDAAGEWKGQIKLPNTTFAQAPNAQITAVAVDDKTGDVYIVYNFEPIVEEFGPADEVIGSLPIPPREGGNTVKIRAITIDSASRLAVAVEEELIGPTEQFGSLYDAGSGHLITGFKIGISSNGQKIKGMGFNGKDELYAALAENHEVTSYKAEPAAELITGSTTCKTGSERDTSKTFSCALNGEVNPYNVPNTEIWFEWGRSCPQLSRTAKQTVETGESLLPVGAQVEDLRPNEVFCYRLAGADQNVQSPEELTGDQASFSTPAVPPKLVGEPNVSFVTSSSAVMRGELNPENSPTEYFFEYAPEGALGEKTLVKCLGIKITVCPGVASTRIIKSTQYGRIGATFGATGLQPNTVYRYRLAAAGEAGQSPPGPEGSFTTAVAPSVQAQTFPASSVTTTSALASGTVDPDGQPAVYTFELGIYRGDAIQYATVASGQTGTGTSEPESLTLTGLQPATTYAYRIAIHSGYGTAQAAPVIFTTSSLPPLKEEPATSILSIPAITFPHAIPTCKRGYFLTKGHKCIKMVKKKKRTKRRKR